MRKKEKNLLNEKMVERVKGPWVSREEKVKMNKGKKEKKRGRDINGWSNG